MKIQILTNIYLVQIFNNTYSPIAYTHSQVIVRWSVDRLAGRPVLLNQSFQMIEVKKGAQCKYRKKTRKSDDKKWRTCSKLIKHESYEHEQW